MVITICDSVENIKMTKICDHKSVGIIIRRDCKILLIERGKSPFGFAVPAGHVDNHGSFEQAAREETQEEVGLRIKSLALITEGRKENCCRRIHGTWHYWKIYEVETEGKIKRSLDETKQAGYFSLEEIRQLTKKTEDYLKGKIAQNDWQVSPGLEPIWLEWFKELKII